MTNWYFETFSDLNVVRYDPEMADFENQRGAVYGEVFYIRAVDDEGNRKVLVSIDFKTEDEAGRFMNTLTEFSPNSKDWVEIQPVYGSNAYIENDGEQWLMDDEEARRRY